jgi:hypothetical protein
MRRAAGLIALTLALAGCAGESESDRAGDAVHEWVEALADRDGAKACGAMTPTGRYELVLMLQIWVNGPRDLDDCERQVAGIGGSPGKGEADVEIANVSVDGARATVETEGNPEGGPSRVQLRRDGDRWLVHGFLLDGWRGFGIPDYPPGTAPPGYAPPG